LGKTTRKNHEWKRSRRKDLPMSERGGEGKKKRQGVEKGRKKNLAGFEREERRSDSTGKVESEKKKHHCAPR